MQAFACLLLAAFLLHQPASADLVGIEYYDRGSANPLTNGGPLWTGEVDTAAGTLRFTSWVELPLHGEEFWVPQFSPASPMIWHAVGSNGQPYTLPDDFGPVVGQGVTIDNNFAFISPVAANQMAWADITGATKSFGTIHPPTRIGWGGFAQITTAGGAWIYHTSSVGQESAYDQTTMPRVPVAENNMFASLGGEVRVTYRTVSESEPSPGGNVSAIPEAGAVVRLSLLTVGAALAVWFNRRGLVRRS